MYQDTLEHFASIAERKSGWIKSSPHSFAISALMAGAYVGLGIILIFSVAATIDPPWQKLIMGLSFGIALTLIVFAGAELFTGHTMYMTIGLLYRRTGVKDLFSIWSIAWLFNLIGSAALAWIFVLGGGGTLLSDGATLLNKVAAYKMNSPAVELFARAILCNWLVCLALWMAARCQSDSGKAIVIFWCLFAFIASGYEHSVANMTLLTIALLGDHPQTISLAGMFHNLLWVSIGNIVGGALFMAVGYWLASDTKAINHSPEKEQLISDKELIQESQ